MGDHSSANSGSTESSGEESEDSESSSSSSSSSDESSLLGRFRASAASAELDLSQFREKWRQEIHSRRTNGNQKSGCAEESADGGLGLDASNDSSLEANAKRLFRLGSREETNGNLYVAIEYYKRACQLMPDVELRIAEEQHSRRRRNSYRRRFDSESSVDSNGSTGVCLAAEADKAKMTLHHVEEAEEPLEGDRTCPVGILPRSYGWCDPEVPLEDPKTRHISDLPIEVLFYIFKWVVGGHLDTAALGKLALVCRSFWSLARDEELWRLVCVRQWGANCGARPADLDFPSWRAMAILRPHVHFNGCYMGKISYVRSGEPTLGAVYRPYYVVEYYRCLRFFPDGTVLMMTSPEEPSAQVRALSISPPARTTQGLMQGRYRISGSTVSGLLHWPSSSQAPASNWRSRRRPAVLQSEHIEQTFQVRFVIKSSKKKLHNVLDWQSYAIIQKYKSGREVVTDFDVKSDAYPSLYFSRVKSYTAAVADAPLQ